MRLSYGLLVCWWASVHASSKHSTRGKCVGASATFFARWMAREFEFCMDNSISTFGTWIGICSIHIINIRTPRRYKAITVPATSMPHLECTKRDIGTGRLLCFQCNHCFSGYATNSCSSHLVFVFFNAFCLLPLLDEGQTSTFKQTSKRLLSHLQVQPTHEVPCQSAASRGGD